MVVAKGKIEHGIVEVILEEKPTLRAIAFIYPDGSGRTELQRKLTPQSEWMTIINEPRSREYMQEHTVIREDD